jgi:hypothetical protein
MPVTATTHIPVTARNCRCMQEADLPSLSEGERVLLLRLHDSERRGWLSFRDWAVWWAATR